MFHDQQLPNIAIKTSLGDREQILHLDLQITPQGQIHLQRLVSFVLSTFQLESHLLVFYLNHSKSTFELVQPQLTGFVHFTSLISQNLITLKIQHKPTDQLLANPLKEQQDPRTKRHPQRIIEQAFLLVEQWRYFYRQGCLNEHVPLSATKSIKMKINLDQSAQMIGVPRKTLEDYFLLFRTGKSLEFDFKKSRRERIGTLRAFIRQQGKKITNSSKELDQNKFFRELRFQILNEKQQEQLFDILNRSHSSSDQDMVFEH